jgi:hypothetical protein
MTDLSAALAVRPRAGASALLRLAAGLLLVLAALGGAGRAFELPGPDLDDPFAAAPRRTAGRRRAETRPALAGPDLDAAEEELLRPAGTLRPEEGGGAGRSVLVQLDGSGSGDPDGDAITYRWSQIGGPRVTLSDAAAARPWFRAREPGLYRFALTVSDGTRESDPAVVEVRVERINLPPEARAPRRATVTVGQRFVLDGSESRDADGDPLTYHWRQTAGPPLFLDEKAAARAELALRLEQEAVYEFEFRVHDGHAWSAPVVCRVVAEAPNRAPQAHAGRTRVVRLDPPEAQVAGERPPEAPLARVARKELVVTLGDRVVLDGSPSRSPRNLPLKYYWKQRGGPFVREFSRPGGEPAKLAFEARSLGEYDFSLVVNDGEFDSAPCRLRVLVVEGNMPPKAVIDAPEKAAVGARVVLDGSGSADRESGRLTYRWRQVEGPRVLATGLAEKNPAKAVFTPGRPGVYTFELVVDDGVQESRPARASVLVERGNTAPRVEVAGNLSAAPGESFVLAARGIDPDEQPLTYRWTQVGGPPLLRGAARQRSLELQAARPGEYRFEVVAHDGRDRSAPARCVVRVARPNRGPVAAVRQRAAAVVEETIELDGRASRDPDEDRLTYRWSVVEGGAGGACRLRNETAAVAQFSARTPGEYEVELVVSDGQDESAPATVRITVGADPEQRLTESVASVREALASLPEEF